MRGVKSVLCLGMLAAGVSLTQQGCILVPFIDAFKQTGVAEGDRQQLLAPEMKRFSDNLAAGSLPTALAYATAEARKDLARKYEKVGTDEKVVDSKVIDVEFSEDSYKASAKVAVRYFEVPFYIVRTRREQQEWVFSVSTGWKISGVTVNAES